MIDGLLHGALQALMRTWGWWVLAAGLIAVALGTGQGWILIASGLVVVIRLVFGWLEKQARVGLEEEADRQKREGSDSSERGRN